jgi:hypothetical protein
MWTSSHSHLPVRLPAHAVLSAPYSCRHACTLLCLHCLAHAVLLARPCGACPTVERCPAHGLLHGTTSSPMRGLLRGMPSSLARPPPRCDRRDGTAGSHGWRHGFGLPDGSYSPHCSESRSSRWLLIAPNRGVWLFPSVPRPAARSSMPTPVRRSHDGWRSLALDEPLPSSVCITIAQMVKH